MEIFSSHRSDPECWNGRGLAGSEDLVRYRLHARGQGEGEWQDLRGIDLLSPGTGLADLDGHDGVQHDHGLSARAVSSDRESDPLGGWGSMELWVETHGGGNYPIEAG